MDIKKGPVNLKDYDSGIDIRLVEFEGTLCAIITGISLDEIECNPDLALSIKSHVKRLIQANRDIGWQITAPARDR